MRPSPGVLCHLHDTADEKPMARLSSVSGPRKVTGFRDQLEATLKSKFPDTQISRSTRAYFCKNFTTASVREWTFSFSKMLFT